MVQLILLGIVPIKFDTSSDNYLERHGYGVKYLNNFINWDNVYFTKLFNTDEVIFEHEYVFSPVFTRLIRSIEVGFYSRLVIAIVVSNLCHFATCLLCARLSKLYFNDDKLSRMAFIMCSLSVGGVFLTNSYSESLCSLLTFTSMYLRETSLVYEGNRYKVHRFARYLLSGVLILVSFGVRSNSLLYGFFYIYDSLFFISTFQLKNCLKALVTGFFIFVSFCQSVGAAYMEFCPNRGEWCFHRIPSLLYFAQSHYWNNGFLNYWTPNNIPNFLFMIPNFIVLIVSCVHYLQYPKVLPLLLMTLIYLTLNFLFWHVQIMNRISSFVPLQYWYISQLYFRNRTILNTIVSFNIIWIIVQSGLFALFLPPA